MKVRSLKQALHWLFLAVGILSVAMLAFSVSTYLGYAEEGYGLGVDIADVEFAEGKLYFTVQLDNPGGLDMVVKGPGTVALGNGSAHQVSLNEGVMGWKTAGRVFSVTLDADEIAYIFSGGTIDVAFDLTITVDERDLTTHLAFSAEDLEVAT